MLNFSNHIQLTQPKDDEFELSLFGPGVGECIVAHLGDGKWAIIDSCIDNRTAKPTPLVYLDRLGVNTAKSVKLFVITHWHADHIRGAATIARHCANATVCFSSVFLQEEFLSLVAAYSGLGSSILVDKTTCGTKEIASIIEIIKERMEKEPPSDDIFDLVSANKRLFKSGLFDIWALSPSSKAEMEGLQEIARLLTNVEKNQIRKVIPAPTQNHNSVALLLKSKQVFDAILGSDLEEKKDSLSGWSAIVGSKRRPESTALIFKIPHHGSENAHCHDVWDKLLDKRPIGIMTTKLGGKTCPPQEKDIMRLKEYTNCLYSTSLPKSRRQKRDRVVEKTIKGIVTKRIPLSGEIGQIQIRAKNRDNIAVNLKDPAIQL